MAYWVADVPSPRLLVPIFINGNDARKPRRKCAIVQKLNLHARINLGG